MTNPETRGPRIAYLTGEYPAVSHTFIQREVAALRERGLDVLTCSIRRTGPEHHRGDAGREAARTTFYVLAAAAQPLNFLRATLAALRTPGRFFQALRLAIRTSPPGPQAFLWQMFYLGEALILARHLRRERITHLHNHFADSSASVAMLASVLSDIPFSYTLHGPSELFEASRWAIGTKTAQACFTVCISHYARSQVMFFSAPAHWKKIKVVHCGVFPELYDRTNKLNHQQVHLVFVGRLTAVKGVPVLIEAFSSIHERHPQLRLTLVGDGDGRRALEAQAAPLGDSVDFTGYRSQEEVAEILATADIFVLPSFAEGVPVVLMEAMASGKPVIATQVAGVPELVDDGESGILVPPGDIVSLANAISKLVADPELRRRMGTKGRAKIQEEFDVRKEAAHLLALFQGAKTPTPPGVPSA